VSRSSNQGCSWSTSTAIAGSTVRDVFADPLDPARVWAIALGFQPGAPNAVYLSQDRAATFGAPLYSEPSGTLTGIEASTTTPGVALGAGYLFGADGGPDLPYLLRTDDSGATWTRFPHPEVAPRRLGIAQVDPADDHQAYLRIGLSTGQDALGLATDGGAAIEILQELGEAMSAFALGSDGALYTGSRLGHLWVRPPGATSFTQRSGPLLRCLGERAGKLYACGDDFQDGFALGVSTDRGATFTPLLRLQDIATLQACAPVQHACGVPLATLQETVGYQKPSSAPPPPAPKAGCGCQPGGGLAPLLLLGLGLGLKRRRARGPAGGP
jgi:uncharacterized protein (TIGR03382 family)